jgi:lipid II:glycine glycyltransferase (peptidoglycan interpeptide bridge formation enzyme)
MLRHHDGLLAEINEISPAEWADALTSFADASIYQCWPYGSIKWGGDNSEHVVLKKAGGILSLAQVAIVKPPVPGVGMAYVTWGPVWKKKDSAQDESSYRSMLEVLKDEYAHRRKLLLRVKPYGYEETDGAMRSVLEQAGFLPTKGVQREKKRTILVNLDPSPDDMRRRLSKKWRNSLTNSEKEGLTVKEGFSTEPLYAIRSMYQALMKKKNFSGWDLDELARIQTMLEGRQRMRISTCDDEGRTIAASVCSALGDTTVGLIGMTSDEGRKKRAYYLLQWDEILWAKKSGAASYDLNGINPRTNPTVYHFKSGINGDEVTFLSVHDYCQSRFLSALINQAERIIDLSMARTLLGLIRRPARRSPGRSTDR